MSTLGVVGAGTMGAGIAQVAAQQGLPVVLLDLQPALAEAAVRRIHESFQREVRRGRMSQGEANEAIGRITTALGFADLASVQWAIEAVPEEIGLKGQVFRQLDESCREAAILATNTSSLSVSEIAAATERPHRVVGLHFFNPVPAMALVEVVRGSATSEESMEHALDLARQLGKTPICVADFPGFIVNRVVRPFYTEALRLLAEGVASHQNIDRIMRATGFRMGPFELMDLIGNDVNLAVTTSIYEQLYGEPRFRPSVLQRRLVRSGRLGQKTGSGWYEYPSSRAESARPPLPKGEGRGEGVLGFRGLPPSIGVVADGPLGLELADLLKAAGTDVQLVRVEGHQVKEGLPLEGLGTAVAQAGLVIEASMGTPEAKRALLQEIDARAPASASIAALALTVSATEMASWCAHPTRLCGFGYVPPLAEAKLIEIAPALQTAASARQAVEGLAGALGKEIAAVGDSPGLVAPRILSLIVNEAAWALVEGVAGAADIDLAVRLGANYPKGPLAWGDSLGLDVVYGIIKGMEREFGDGRYRVAPLLRRLVLAGWLGKASGRGFFTYPF